MPAKASISLPGAQNPDHFHTLAENIPAVLYEYVFRKDGSHGFKYVSPAVEKVFGLSVAEYINYKQYLPPEEQQIIEDKNNHSRLTHEPFYFEGRLLIPGRSVIWHAMHASFSYETEDGSKVFSGVILDISERKKAEEKLKINDDRFRLLVNSIQDYAIFMLDSNGCITSWNSGAEQIKGYHEKEIIGEHISVFYRTDDVKHGEPAHNLKMAAQYGRFEKDGWRIRKDGSMFWANILFTALYDEEHHLRGYIKLTRDITEMNKAEKALRESELRFKSLTQNVPGVIYQWYENDDGSSGFSYVSPKLKEYFGIDPEQMNRIAEMIHPDDREKWRLASEAKHHKTTWSFEGRLLYPDGSIKWWRGNAVMVGQTETGKLYNGIMVDTTQTITMTAELARSNERYNYAAKATSDAIWEWDYKAKKIYRGEGFSNNFGYTIPVVSDKDITQRMHPEDVEAVVQSLNKVIREKADRWHAEYRFLCADGTYRNISNKAYLVWDEHKELSRIIGAMSDLSDQIRLEQQLAEEEKQKKREIIRAIIEAQEKERKEISHELHENISQVLSACRLWLDMAEKDPSSAALCISKCNSNIQEAISELRNITVNLVPQAIKDLGLAAAIKDFVAKTNKSGKLQITCRILKSWEEDSIPENIKLAVFRIVQQRVNGLMRQAAATTLKLDLGFKNKTLFLKLTDNAKDFGKENNGSLLYDIRDRVEYYDGKTSMQMTSGKGCVLRLELPC